MKKCISTKRIKLLEAQMDKYRGNKFMFQWDSFGNHLPVTLDDYELDEDGKVIQVTIGFDSMDCKYYGLDPYMDLDVEKGMKTLWDLGLE